MAHKPRTTLTASQKATAAYLRLVKGLKVEDISIAMNAPLFQVSAAIRNICLALGEPVEALDGE